MLIRLIVENYLSFDKETELNMLTGEVRRHPHHVYKNSKVSVVKSAVIYGANGAGKSNLITAFSFLRDTALGNYSESPETKFKFANNIDKPIKIEVEIFTNGKGYNYGLTVNNGQIENEWLYKLKFDSDDELVFERKRASNKAEIKYSTDLINNSKTKLLLEIIEDEISGDKSSFIQAAQKLKNKDIVNIWEWLKSSNEIVFSMGSHRGTTDFLGATVYGFVYDDNEYQFSNFCNAVLKNLDTGIFELKTIKMSLDEFYGKRNQKDKEEIINKLNNGDTIEVGYDYPNVAYASLEKGEAIVSKMVSLHKSNNGNIKQFELSEESEGTLRILEFLSLFNDLIYTDKTIFIDEIEHSIHPSLLKAIINTLQRQKGTKGQLIFTTHESNLLDLDLFRQDEIWFAEKNKMGATELYPLSDYDVRPDLDIRKGYLSGRFGAIPFLANLKDSNWDTNGKKAEPQL